MKNKVILLVLISFAFALQGQEYSYIPYVQEGSVWSYTQAVFIPEEEDLVSISFLNFTIAADIIHVGSNSYKKVFYGCDGDILYFYCGALREQDQKVYFTAGDEERLVYDFSLKVGDTFLALGSLDTSIIVVSNIDTMQINGGYRKVFYFGDSSITDNFWIEGIGSINHAMEPFAIMPEKSYFGINYKKENGEIVYHSTEAWFNENDCESVNIENAAKHQSNVLFQNSPNPFNKSTTIKYLLSENTKNAKICIYDLQGKQLQCYPLKAIQSEIEVKAFALQSGVYVYSLIINDRRIATKRMVLME